MAKRKTKQEQAMLDDMNTGTITLTKGELWYVFKQVCACHDWGIACNDAILQGIITTDATQPKYLLYVAGQMLEAIDRERIRLDQAHKWNQQNNEPEEG